MSTIKLTINQTKATRTLDHLLKDLHNKRIADIRPTPTEMVLITTDSQEIVVGWDKGPVLESIDLLVPIPDIQVESVQTVVQGS